MGTFSRRDFIKSTAIGMTAAGVLAAAAKEAGANPLGFPIGCQTYPVRKSIQTDFPGTLKQLSDAGFTQIELCSPFGYDEFAGLKTYKGAELRKIMADNGIHCISAHFDMKELTDNLQSTIAWAKDLGLTQMMVPSLDGPRMPTADDVKKACDDFNKIAADVAKAGLQQGVHNEGWLSRSLPDGTKVYDTVISLLDPKTVKFQFQVSQIVQGFDPVTYLTKYPGRFISLHCQGIDANHKQVAIGSADDTVKWPDVFAAAKVGGIKNFFVEMNLPLMQASVPYLKTLS
jgi:sugar phosphate isomerase/epimerase